MKPKACLLLKLFNRPSHSQEISESPCLSTMAPDTVSNEFAVSPPDFGLLDATAGQSFVSEQSSTGATFSANGFPHFLRLPRVNITVSPARTDQSSSAWLHLRRENQMPSFSTGDTIKPYPLDASKLTTVPRKRSPDTVSFVSVFCELVGERGSSTSPEVVDAAEVDRPGDALKGAGNTGSTFSVSSLGTNEFEFSCSSLKSGS
mmetsp:Transcript_31447/g.83768  ORF Transcript_31447/g.83768 Transcript_31447/m.83768 type:complete len:204 (-) Transcript_31447:534-1145(-)